MMVCKCIQTLKLNNQYLFQCSNVRQQLQPSGLVDTCVSVLYIWTLRFSLLVSLQLRQADTRLGSGLQDISSIVSRPLLCCFGFMFGVAVMLENPSSPTAQFLQAEESFSPAFSCILQPSSESVSTEWSVCFFFFSWPVFVRLVFDPAAMWLLWHMWQLSLVLNVDLDSSSWPVWKISVHLSFLEMTDEQWLSASWNSVEAEKYHTAVGEALQLGTNRSIFSVPTLIVIPGCSISADTWYSSDTTVELMNCVPYPMEES